DRQGIFTFTCAAVFGALRAAAELAMLFNDQESRARYLTASDEIREAMMQHLWLDDEGRFARGFLLEGDDLVLDRTIDSSAFGAFYFGVFSPSSAMVEGTMKAIRDVLWVQTETGGLARYENDPYQAASSDREHVPGNPWLICTLWLAEHAIARATS